jgi:hypothetical protein
MVRHDDRLVDFLDQQLAADFLAQGRVVLFQETSLAGQRLDHTQAFQFGIGLRDRITVEVKLFRERPDGGERLAWPQCPRCRRNLNLIDQLEIGRFSGLEIDLKKQICGPLSYDSMTVV